MKSWLTKSKETYERFLEKPKVQRGWQEMERFSALQLSEGAASMTFWLFLSLFPYAIFMVTLIAFVVSNLEIDSSLRPLLALIPRPIFNYLSPIVEDITANFHISLLSVNALSLLWASTKSFSTFLRVTNDIYKKEHHNYFMQKILGVCFIILLTLLVMALLIGVSFGSQLLEKLAEWTGLPIFSGNLLHSLRFLLPLLSIDLLFTLIYYACARGQGGFWWAALYALVPTFAWLGLAKGLSWAIFNFTTYDLIYGSVTGMIILLLWFYLLMFILFFGAYLHQRGLEWRASRALDRQGVQQETVGARSRPEGEEPAERVEEVSEPEVVSASLRTEN